MSNDGVNAGRRRFLVAATSVVGAAGRWVLRLRSWVMVLMCQGQSGRRTGESEYRQGRTRPADGRRMARSAGVHRASYRGDLANLTKIEGSVADPGSAASVQPAYVDKDPCDQAGASGAGRPVYPPGCSIRPSVRKWRLPTSARTGSVVTSALATARATTWRSCLKGQPAR